ncbi:ABC transporter permease [Duganella vulcania]|uniref:FtsX-like permease family protein n=1 Tax=Duganella vulcania TaxID=2692166 RepID=A0A845GQK6_9BURK|nr:FtsX-like permease family protein [Duganella vulcania]MYM95855.1 FtsX-like permease family protein [Duganella vulcania]
MFRLSLSMLRRDWRAGELRFLLAALMLSVAALSSVNFFTARMGAGIARNANQVLAADLVLASDQPLPDDLRAEAQRRGLRSAGTVAMLNMALAGTDGQGASMLVALKSVSDAYPLRGHMKLCREGQPDAVAASIPAPGTVWVDPALTAALHLRLGSTLRIGERALTVAGVIASEPDAAASFLTLAPRAMINSADLMSTNLLQQHAIATHRLLVAGEPAQVAGFEQWVKARIAAAPRLGIEINSLASAGKENQSMQDQVRQFLSLVGLLSALLAGIAVAMAARRYVQRHLDACAVLRCLGQTQSQQIRMYLLEFLMLGVAGSVIGVLLGFGCHFVLLEWLGKLVDADLPPPGWQPALQGMVAGLALLLGFALPPLLQMRNVSQVRLLRREQEAPQARTIASYALGAGVFTALLVWQTDDVMLGLIAAAAFALCGLVFGLAAWLGVGALRPMRGLFNHPAWRFAVTDMRRRPAASITQIVALALGLTALLLLTVVRGDLLSAWRQATPDGAPNHYIINIEPDQRQALESRLKRYGQPAMHVLSRGRLVGINGKPAKSDDPRAREMVEREMEIEQADTLLAPNTITAGRWYDGTAAEVSVNEGIAEILGIKLGDRLTFDVAGETLDVKATSLRKVDWRAHQVGASFEVAPGLMTAMPATLATTVYVPADDQRFSYLLAHDYPNVSVLDISAFIQRMQDTLAQVSAAVEFLFAFTLLSGLLVLYAAMAGSLDARKRQAALLRALGATRRQLSQAQWIEHLLTGALAGLLAAGGATAANWALARFSFHLAWQWSPWLWTAGLLAGALCALAGGWAGLRNVLNQPPLLSLREN